MARILTVDDHPHIRRVIEHVLSRLGHEVIGASDGAEALATLHARPIDILITDVDMPEVDGLTLLYRVAAEGLVRAAVVITGRVDYQMLDTPAAIEVRVLPKPFRPSALVEVIGDYLRRDEPAAAVAATAN